MKKCPYCAEDIQEEAIVCKHCGAKATPTGWVPSHLPEVPKQSTSGLAVASLVCGILWGYWLGSVLALIFGYIAKSNINASNGALTGRGMAIAGIIIGWCSIASIPVLILLMVFAGI